MPIGRTRLGRGTAALAAGLLCAAGGCEPAKQDRNRGGPPAASVSVQPMLRIERGSPSVRIPVESLPRASGDAFVAVEIREVVNPRRVPLTFEVGFQPAQGGLVRLGEFSLFPPDNPGRFIVATQGRIQDDGVIVVAMAEGDRAAAAEVRVGIAGVTLTDR